MLSMKMREILDVDCLCLKEIFKYLTPMDLCSTRQSCTKLRDFVDDHFRLHYFAREQWLDLRTENVGNVKKILNNFGNYVSHLKVGEEPRASNLLLEVIATNCCDVLKGLSLNRVYFYRIDMERFARIFNNLVILELSFCIRDQRYIEQFLLGHQYPNLTTLKVLSVIETEILEKFFMKKRNIKKLSCWYISGDTLPLIVQNSAEMKELNISLKDGGNLLSLAQLRKLKLLKISGLQFDQNIIALINELSVNNQIEMLGIGCYYDHYTDEFFDALTNLTNLKELQLMNGAVDLTDNKSIELLVQNLSKLESLVLVDCSAFPYQHFFELACNSNTFRTIYIRASGETEIKNVIELMEVMIRDFINGGGHHCLVSGNPLCIYLHKKLFDRMEGLLMQDNLQSMEQYGNIKILSTNFNKII